MWFQKECVACIDGYLLQIMVPACSETGNVKSYFSGHYQTYGINIQAACDHKCRFVYAAVAAPEEEMTLQHFKNSVT